MGEMTSYTERILGFLSPSTYTVPCRVSQKSCVAVPKPSPNISLRGHVVMSIVWWGLILGYAALVTYQWATAPDARVLSYEPSSGYAYPNITLLASCTNEPNCGVITVTLDYTGVADCEALTPSGPLVFSVAAADAAALELPLCYTGSYVLSTDTPGPISVPGIVVDYSSINPGFNSTGSFPTLAAQGVVRVFDSSTGELIRVVNLASWQVKTLRINQAITARSGVVESRQLFSEGTQYEGRRTSRRATLIVALSEIAQVVTVVSNGPSFTAMSLFSLTAGWLGIVWLLKAVAPHVFVPVFAKIFGI